MELDFKEAYLLTPWPTAPITAPSVNDNAASPNESISPFIASTAKLEAAPVIVALARGPTPGIGIAETAPLTAPDNTALPNPSFQSLSWRTLSITLAAPLINAPTPAPIPIAAKRLNCLLHQHILKDYYGSMYSGLNLMDHPVFH